jgi:glycosyltransferase involved in cell wall biosynthesis
MDKPLVSIITVCYNASSHIGNAIDCVLAQTYHYIEHIIIDGGSNDGTQDVIRKQSCHYSKRGFGLVFFSEPDEGIYDAMNKGIINSKGHIIGIMNADDAYMPEAVANVVNVFSDRANLLLVHGRVRMVNDDGCFLKTQGEHFSTLMFADKTPFNHPSMFVSRKLYDKIGLFDKKYKTAADYDFMLRVVKNGIPTQYIDETISTIKLVGVTTSRNWPFAGEIYSVLYKNNFSQAQIILGIFSRFIKISTKIALNSIGVWKLIQPASRYNDPLNK